MPGIWTDQYFWTVYGRMIGESNWYLRGGCRSVFFEVIFISI